MLLHGPCSARDGTVDSDLGSEYDPECSSASQSDAGDFDLAEAEPLDEDELATVVASEPMRSDGSDLSVEPDEVEDVARAIQQFEKDTASTSSDVPEIAGNFLDEGQYNGNRLPPEYYQRAVKQLNEEEFLKRDYSQAMLDAIERIQRQWTQYVPHENYVHLKMLMQTPSGTAKRPFIRTRRRPLRRSTSVSFTASSNGALTRPLIRMATRNATWEQRAPSSHYGVRSVSSIGTSSERSSTRVSIAKRSPM